MSALCKYCQKVELVFDEHFKSKSGKLIPLDKASGRPHQCSENPYSQTKQQQQQQESNEQENSLLPSVSDESVRKGLAAFTIGSIIIKKIEDTQKQISAIDTKLERLLNLAERK